MHAPHHRASLLAACLAFAVTACASTTPAPASKPAGTRASSTAQEAVANLASASGSRVSGRLTLMPMGGGVHVRGEVGGLAPGSAHGFHIHEKGDCSAADAASAGGHFNPAARPHGRAGQGAHHAGDADNLVADARGVAKVDVHVGGVTLGGGAANDIAGRAVVVHATADDYSPAGRQCRRRGCGVIRSGAGPAGSMSRPSGQCTNSSHRMPCRPRRRAGRWTSRSRVQARAASGRCVTLPPRWIEQASSPRHRVTRQRSAPHPATPPPRVPHGFPAWSIAFAGDVGVLHRDHRGEVCS